MFKTVSVAVIASAMAMSANAQDAGSTYYVEVGASSIEFLDEDFGTLNLGVGYNFNRNFAVEGNLAFGVTEKTYDFDGDEIKAKVDYTLGVYAVGSLPVSENVDLLGRIGFVKGQFKVSGFGVSASEDDSGPALGVGVRYFPNGGVHGVRADYTRYEFDDVDGQFIQVSYVRRF